VTVRPLRIAFFGLPLAAVLLARDGHTIVYAGACRRALGLRRLSKHVAPGRTYLRPKVTDTATIERVRASQPDLVVSWFWTTRLPEAISSLAPSVGVHPSLLPRHRGPDPCFWAIASGDEVTGVTAHRLAAEYDTGDVLARRELGIDPSWDGWRLAKALDRPSLALLRDVVRAYAEGRPPTPVAQDTRLATAAPEPTHEELAIVWSKPAVVIERLVRAAAPWPGAWTEIGDRLVTLLRVRVTTDYPRALMASEAAVRHDGIAVVRAGDDALELTRARDEDDAALGPEELATLVRSVRHES
jgi:methionyl-tRNA formyltransferase